MEPRIKAETPTKMELNNIILPSHGSDRTFEITVADSIITAITPSATQRKCPSLLLPALCHPHLHLDKAYLLTSDNPRYSHLVPRTGTFSEALTTTMQAKSLYTDEDLYLRGAQLLSIIYSQGATTARTFVEVDAMTGTRTLKAAIKLKRDFAHLIRLQIVAFAQEPLFSKEDGKANRRILEEALASEAAVDVEVLGTTPYVEASREASSENIKWAIQTAINHKLHLDLHLDYNLNADIHHPTARPLTFDVVSNIQTAGWNARNKGKTVVLGHCTQLSLLPEDVVRNLADQITKEALPIHFVGLPTSDLFMMGRGEHPAPRGTLPVLEFIRAPNNLNACLGANNVGNAFTPFGTADPLHLASWGVGIHQAGTEAEAETLFGCVSWRARRAIGLASEQDEKDGRETDLTVGMEWKPMLLVENRDAVELPGFDCGNGQPRVMSIPARQRRSVRDVVWDPPEVSIRKVIR